MWNEPVPGIPGRFSEIAWIDTCDYGGEPEDRRVDDSMVDLNPEPLARFVATGLHLIPGSRDAIGEAIADDEMDGPIHIVHLLVACERSAQLVGGGLPRPGSPGNATQAALTIMAASGHIIPAMASALYDGGPGAAVALVRGWNSETRKLALDALWAYWVLPIAALCEDVPNSVFRSKP